MEDKIVEFILNMRGRYKTFSFKVFETWIWWVVFGATIFINTLFWPLVILCVIMLFISYKKKMENKDV